ncbi:ABC transporter substrate-binding protein [Shinella sp. CPCC 101442]|uniref:ABC transporter substrate-binding protein n=1 Tax=Shinella sp. CPCC 101442 TaxID=2932265 RepID=UPI00215290B1|nr:ABC transporter substrate-binding protein [Shinella sp. CPCC 101442]MCR6497984.1 ABC transporter substrate-binding protein [Shinella sp. CPCC 101442]
MKLFPTLAAGVSLVAATYSYAAHAGEDDKYGGTLVVAQNAEITQLDPGRQLGWETFRITRHIFDALVSEDLSKSGNDEPSPAIIPALAESWAVSPDGKVYTFKLRQGVKFHDGTDFNAEAVAFNIRRAWDPSFEFYDEVTAVNVRNTYIYLDKVETPDASTVVLTFKQPFSPLLRLLAQGSGGTGLIASPESIRKYGNDGVVEHPTGTGPYKFVERIRGQSVEIERFDDYWGEKPYLDRIVFRPIPDGNARVAALETGEVDLISWPPRDAVERLKGEGFDVPNVSIPSIYYYNVNFANEAFKDVRVRQALVHAIDREALARDLLKGTASPGYSVLVPGSAAFDPAFRDYNFDPEKSKALLKEAGLEKGVSATISIYAGGEAVAEWVQRDAAKVGINLNIRSYDWNSFLAQERTPGADVGFSSMEWGFLTPYWLSIVGNSNSGSNTGGYKSEAFDAAVSKAIAATDPAQEVANWREANRIIAEDVGKIPLFLERTHYAVGKNVRDFASPAQAWYDLKKVWLAEK